MKIQCMRAFCSALAAQQMAQQIMKQWPAGRFAPPTANWRWNYELGTFLDGIDAMGRMDIPAGGPIFHHPHVLFMKDTSSLTLSTDGRKLWPDYDNFAAGMELVRWLVQQTGR